MSFFFLSSLNRISNFFLFIQNIQIHFNRRSLAFIVLITGIVGGLLIVFSILLLCKYCINRKNLREAEQVKLLYEALNQAANLDSNRLYKCGTREFSRLEPRRSNPLDRYQLPEDQWQIPSSKPVTSDYHSSNIQNVYNQSYHENREQNGNKQHDNVYRKTSTDDEPGEQYLQVDPRCYVRQNSNSSTISYKKSDTPRLEKGHSINVDTRPSPTSTLSPYRQSSFDVTLAYPSHNQQILIPSPANSTQQEIYFTPRGSSLSVVGNTPTNTPPGSQHLSPPTPIPSQTSKVRSSIVQREHEHSRSLEHSSPSNNSAVDKQSRSFDAVNLLRPVNYQSDIVTNRRTKSYEYDEEHQPSPPVAPLPIIIKIPNMSELVQAAQLSQLNGYQQDTKRKASQDLWRLRQSYELEEQQQLDRTSPEDLSSDLLTSTSIDSAGAMPIHRTQNKTNVVGDIDDDSSKYQYRRKSSSNLLLPPPEVRRQALRRTFEKRRSCINESNAKREQQILTSLNNEYDNSNLSSTIKSTDYSSLLTNFNSKSENSSFDRSLETDFDMQSDTSSRGPNDHFTSIESSGNENALPDVNHSFLTYRQQKQPSHQDDSGYKSVESQNNTFSLDWMSADGGESVIYVGDSHIQQQRSTDIKDLEEDLIEQEQKLSNNNRFSIKSQHSYQENPSIRSQRNTLVTSSSFNRTASKKRREFSKDKRHATSNVGLPYLITTDEHQFLSPVIHQINEGNTKHTLQVRHIDLQRSKSDETEVIESHSVEPNNTTQLSSSDDVLLHSTPLSNLIRPTNTRDSRQIFQRSPSSTTPPVMISPQTAAFRSKRGSISFDNQTPISKPIKTSTIDSNLPTNITKTRLKFSMVRDTTTSSLGSAIPNYTMPLTNDYSMDEKTNRVINEFLMQDENNSNNLSYRESPKRHQQRIRQKTFDETMMINNNNIQKQFRTALIKQRQHSSLQTNIRQHTAPHYSSFHVSNRIEQDEDNIDLASFPPTFIHESTPVAGRDNITTLGSPSIIVTGYDSGS